MPLKQVATLLNTYVRTKYTYALTIAGVCKEVEEEDMKWGEVELKGLLKTRTAIAGKGRGKFEVLLQIEQLKWLVEREAGRTIRRWKHRAGEKEGGKVS